MRRKTLALIVLFLSFLLASVTVQGAEAEPTGPEPPEELEQSWPDNDVELLEQSWPDEGDEGESG
jgi:hypothetical protein